MTKALLNEFQSIKSQASLQPLDSNQGYRDKDSEEGSEGHQGSDEKSDDSAHDPSSDHKEVWSVVHNPDKQKSGTRLKPEEWSFARGMLYSVSLLSTVGKFVGEERERKTRARVLYLDLICALGTQFVPWTTDVK